MLVPGAQRDLGLMSGEWEFVILWKCGSINIIKNCFTK